MGMRSSSALPKTILPKFLLVLFQKPINTYANPGTLLMKTLPSGGFTSPSVQKGCWFLNFKFYNYNIKQATRVSAHLRRPATIYETSNLSVAALISPNFRAAKLLPSKAGHDILSRSTLNYENSSLPRPPAPIYKNTKALLAIYSSSTFPWRRDIIIVRAQCPLQFCTPPVPLSTVSLSSNQIQCFPRRPAPISSSPTIAPTCTCSSEPSRLPSQNQNKMWWHAPAPRQIVCIMARPWPYLFTCWQTCYQHAPAKNDVFYCREDAFIICVLIGFDVKILLLVFVITG